MENSTLERVAMHFLRLLTHSGFGKMNPEEKNRGKSLLYFECLKYTLHGASYAAWRIPDLGIRIRSQDPG
jgi:hypothetical protein